MKRIVVFVLALVCGVVCSNGFAKKPAKQQPTTEEQAIQDSLAFVEQNGKQELDQLDLQRKLELLNELEALEAKLKNEEEQHKARLESERKAALPEEEITIPCSKESQSDDEYYGVLGKGTGHNMSRAMIDATQKAQIELLKVVGDELIDYKIEKVCQIYYQDKYGMFNVYVALRYPKIIKDKE